VSVCNIIVPYRWYSCTISYEIDRQWWFLDKIAPSGYPAIVRYDLYMRTKVSQAELHEFSNCQTLAELEDLAIFYYGWNDGEAG
jgi:hypothetical protein